jgi:hypothetical protein
MPRAAAATGFIRAGVAGAADRRIGRSAGAVSVTNRTSPAGRSVLGSIAGPGAVADHAARVAARAAFTFWITADRVGRALASPTGLVAGHAGAIARALATHPIHAEARGADTRAGTSRAVLSLCSCRCRRTPVRAGTATGNFRARAARTQVPSWPATLHDWQAPEQDATAQHTPSTQNPEAQVDAVAAVHPSPLPRLVLCTPRCRW